MLWPVTVAGAGLGGLIGGIPGGVFGAVLGHALDRHWQLQRWSDLPRRWREMTGREASFEKYCFYVWGGWLRPRAEFCRCTCNWPEILCSNIALATRHVCKQCNGSIKARHRTGV